MYTPRGTEEKRSSGRQSVRGKKDKKAMKTTFIDRVVGVRSIGFFGNGEVVEQVQVRAEAG